MLDHPLEHWEAIVGATRESSPGRSGSGLNLGFLRWAYAELALLVADDPFAPDVWQARRVKPSEGTHVRAIDWSRIPQAWLRDAAKRWSRVRVTTLTLGSVTNDARRLARFGQFLASSTHVRWPRDLNRQAMESYLAHLSVELPPTERDGSIGTLRRFLDDAADQGLLDLRRDARVRRTDSPRRAEALRRGVSCRAAAPRRRLPRRPPTGASSTRPCPLSAPCCPPCGATRRQRSCPAS